MKKLLLLFTSISFATTVFPQTFQNSLPATIPPYTTQYTNSWGLKYYYFSCASNYENRLHGQESNVLNGLLVMYETTNDIKYLDWFIEHAQGVIDRRNDNLKLLNLKYDKDFYPAPPSNYLPTDGYMAWADGFSVPAGKPEIVNNGQISFPLAKFAYMIKVQHPELKTRVVPALAKKTDATGWYVINNYGDFAELLKIKTNQTCHDYFDWYWSNNNVCYLNNNGTNANVNYHSSIGKAEVYLYKIYESEGNTAYKNYYWHKITRIAQRLVNPNITGWSRDWNNHVVSWRYDGNSSAYSAEDIAHAQLTFSFAALCYLFQIKDYDTNSNLLFDANLMYYMANTFKTKFIKAPQQYWLSIMGDDNSQTMFTNAGEGTAVRYSISMDAAKALYLSPHDADLYNMIADYFYEFSLYGANSSPKYLPNNLGDQTSAAYAISLLAYYKTNANIQNIFDIKAVSRTEVNSAPLSAFGSGRFLYGTGNEFVAARPSDGAVIIYKVNTTNKIEQVATYINNTIPKNWGAIAAGDFIPNNNHDEFVVFNQGDKKLYLFEQNQTNGGNQINSPITFSTQKNLVGIASGNFDGIAGDEIVALSQDDGKIYMYKYDGNSINAVTLTGQPTISAPSGIAVGNLDHDLSNGLEIVTINNNSGSDYNVKIHTINSSTMTFNPTVYNYTGTNGNYSIWNGVTTGDFDGDGHDEIMAHRNYDGDYYLFNLNNNTINVKAKESFPTNWSLGVCSKIRLGNDTFDKLVNVRNNDGNMFVYQITLPQGNLNWRASSSLNEIDDKGFALKPAEIAKDKPSNFMVYPNPFDGTSTVKCVVNETSDVILSIYNLQGVEVKTIVNQRLDAGEYTWAFDCSDLGKAIYFLEITVGDQKNVIKIVNGD